MGKEIPEGCLLIEDDDLERLRTIAAALQGGNDRERDQGHKLWLLVNKIKEQNK